MSDPLAEETIRDLFRSSWLVERARANVYGAWAKLDDAFAARSGKADGRAEILATALEGLGVKPDEPLVEAHTGWLRSMSGDSPGEVPLGDLFVARLGNWVDAHAADFLAAGRPELIRLGDEERADVTFPSSLPGPPPFERVETIPVDPPGKVLFRFGILGDLHFGSERGEMHARAAIDDLNRSGAELVIQLGDLTDHGNKDEFELAAKTLAELEMPLATVMGNHDVYSIEEGRLSGREYYASFFGRQPDGALLTHKGYRFALLDSATNAASPFAAFDFVKGDFLGGPGGAVVNGSLTDAQHEILADVAAPGTEPAFVFLHHPPQPFTGFPPVLFGLRDTDSGRLHATIDSGNVWGLFAGHTHRNKLTREYGTVPALEVGIPRDFPFGIALVDVTENGYAYRFVQLSDEELLRDAYQYAGMIHRRYGLGDERDRGFVWTRPPK
jgi:predicted phosphodiesterase